MGTLTHSNDAANEVWNVRLDMETPSDDLPTYLVGEMRTSYQTWYLVRGVSGEVIGRDLVLADGSTRSSSSLPAGSYWCNEREFELEYRQVQGRDRLVGEWTTTTSGCSGGSITLERQ